MSLEQIKDLLSAAQKLARKEYRDVLQPLVEAQRLARFEQMEISKYREKYAQVPVYTLVLKNIMHLEARIAQARQCLEEMDGELFEPKNKMSKKDFEEAESFIAQARENVLNAIKFQNQLYMQSLKKAA